MYQDILANIGLPEKESDLYETLLKIGPSTMTELTNKTTYKRGDLYNILESLQSWGLVELDENGKKTYRPVHPSHLSDIIRDQAQEFEKNKKAVEDAIPGLKSMFNMISGKPGVRFFEGKEGIIETLNDSLNATEVIYSFLNSDAVDKYGADVDKQYVKTRTNKNVQKHLLVLDTPNARDYFKKNESEFTHVKFLPKELSPFNTGMQIYDNKIAYLTLRKDNIASIIIEDKDIYQMHRNIFEYLWKSIDKLTISSTDKKGLTVFN